MSGNGLCAMHSFVMAFFLDHSDVVCEFSPVTVHLVDCCTAFHWTDILKGRKRGTLGAKMTWKNDGTMLGASHIYLLSFLSGHNCHQMNCRRATASLWEQQDPPWDQLSTSLRRRPLLARPARCGHGQPDAWAVQRCERQTSLHPLDCFVCAVE